MKQLLSSVFILCIVISAFAQKSAHPSTLSIVGGVERSVYLSKQSPYFGLDYEYRVLPFLKLGTGVGIASGDNGYDYEQVRIKREIKGISPYARVLADVLYFESDFDLNIGLGARYFFYDAHYTSNAAIVLGNVATVQESSYAFDQLAYSGVFQALFHVNSRLSVGIGGEYNSLVNKEKIKSLMCTITDFAPPTLGSEFRTHHPVQPLHFTVKAGYRF